MKIDLTITVTAILAISAIISPIVTAIINNRYQVKIKRLELKQEHLNKTTYYVRSIFENYLRYTGKCIACKTRATESDYIEYYFLALTYAPAHISKLLMSINSSLDSNNFYGAASQLEELTPQINELLQHL